MNLRVCLGLAAIVLLSGCSKPEPPSDPNDSVLAASAARSALAPPAPAAPKGAGPEHYIKATDMFGVPSYVYAAPPGSKQDAMVGFSGDVGVEYLGHDESCDCDQIFAIKHGRYDDGKFNRTDLWFKPHSNAVAYAVFAPMDKATGSSALVSRGKLVPQPGTMIYGILTDIRRHLLKAGGAGDETNQFSQSFIRQGPAS